MLHLAFEILSLQSHWYCAKLFLLYSPCLHCVLVIPRSVPGPRPEWDHPRLALRHLGGLPEGRHHRADWLAVAHGWPVHHGGGPVCRPHPRALLPRQV